MNVDGLAVGEYFLQTRYDSTFHVFARDCLGRWKPMCGTRIGDLKYAQRHISILESPDEKWGVDCGKFGCAAVLDVWDRETRFRQFEPEPIITGGADTKGPVYVRRS